MIKAFLLGAAVALCSCKRSPAPEPTASPAVAATAARFAKLAALQEASRVRLAKYGQVFSGVDKRFEGVRAYGKALLALDAAKPWDLDSLTVKSPDYWRATMEMVPQDPSVAFSNAYLCALSGRLNRAEAWLLFGGMGMEPQWAADRDDLKKGIEEARAEISAEIKKGVALHDVGKFKEAIATYDAVLAGAPQDPWALYEKSFAMLAADEKGSAAGREDLYRRIREIDPFYGEAYQGTDHDVINRQRALLLAQVLPFIQGKARDAQGLAAFSQGAEGIFVHDFAAQAYWKLLLTGGDSDKMMSHFFFNLQRLGLEPFVRSVAGAPLLKLVAELEERTPRAGAAPKAAILEYGLYRMSDKIRKASTGGRTSVVAVDGPAEFPVLTEATDRVPARRGVVFGYSFAVPTVGAGLTATILHPAMTCPGLATKSKTSFALEAQRTGAGFAGMFLYGLDTDCELLQGRWTLQIVRGGRSVRLGVDKEGKGIEGAQVTRQDEVLLSKDFEVVASPLQAAVKAPAAKADPFLERACANEIGMFCQDAANDPAAVRPCLIKHANDLLRACREAVMP